MKMQNVLIMLSLLLFAPLVNAQSNPATNFLNALNEEQRKKASLPFNDTSRETWHFLPGTMYKRSGIALHELNKSQKILAFELLKNNLSEVGYLKTKKIIDLERYLGELTGNKVFRDPEKYSIAIYGDPNDDSLWSWSFEGHHITLNFTILDKKVSASPRFFGANPAEIREGTQKGERVLNDEEDLPIELLASMTDEQKSQAIFKAIAFPDIKTLNNSKVEPLETVGIKVQTLNKQQQRILMNIIKEYLSTLPMDLAKERFRAIEISEFNDIRFGWAGSTDISKGHYYRVQGDTFLIEFDNTQNDVNHIHTVWRDFYGDFGRDLIKEHYQNSTHHKNN